MSADRVAREQSDLETFGAVLITDRQLNVVHVSANAPDVLGVDPSSVLGRGLSTVFAAPAVEDLERALEHGVRDVGWRQVVLASTGHVVKLHAFDPGPGLCGLDVLPLPAQAPGTEAQALERVAGWSERLYACASSGELLDIASVVARQITGFAGAWVTVNEPAGHGVVVAADVQDGGRRGVGQRIPQQDMPPDHPQLGERYIPFFVADLDADPTTLLPGNNQLDLQGSSLLRPFPSYLENRAKIGVKALASVPLVVEGRLWGRLSSAHPTASRLTAATQAELRLIGALIGTRLTELLANENALVKEVLSRWSARVARAAAAGSDLDAGLVRDGEALCGVCQADAAIVSIDGRIHCVGAPLRQQSQTRLLSFARERLAASEDPVVAETSLPEQVDLAVAAGYLAIRLGTTPEDVIVWTRGERRRQITWLEQDAGDGQEAGALFAPLSERIEYQQGSTYPWSEAEIQAVRDLREAIGELVIARYGQMQSLNSELLRANEEYDAFAHAAAHDLGAPLRGIRLHSEYLLEELGEELSDPQREEFQTILRLTDRMHQLLGDLLAYAELGNQSWHPVQISLQQAVADAVELLGPHAQDAEFTVADHQLTTDPAGLRQVLVNLVGNAIKYSDARPHITIEVTSLRHAAGMAPLPPKLLDAAADIEVLSVTDRGIGIDPSHHQRIFGLFQQLNPKADGSGAGLALCRLICRRHGGDIWVASEPGQGSTFFAATANQPPSAEPRTPRPDRA